MSSSQSHKLDCNGQACRSCGKCRDWYWDQGSPYFYFFIICFHVTELN
jgi:hypothetical protein